MLIITHTTFHISIVYMSDVFVVIVLFIVMLIVKIIDRDHPTFFVFRFTNTRIHTQISAGKGRSMESITSEGMLKSSNS